MSLHLDHTSDRKPDPTTLVFSAPSIDTAGGEDWRARSLISWVILAGQAGYEVAETEDGGAPRAVNERATWCGNVVVRDADLPDSPGMTYRVHRAPRRRMLTAALRGGDTPTMGWLVLASTFVLPVLEDVEVWDSL